MVVIFTAIRHALRQLFCEHKSQSFTLVTHIQAQCNCCGRTAAGKAVTQVEPAHAAAEVDCDA